jgi:hypothetical protein
MKSLQKISVIQCLTEFAVSFTLDISGILTQFLFNCSPSFLIPARSILMHSLIRVYYLYAGQNSNIFAAGVSGTVSEQHTALHQHVQ